jgi:2,5-furandicarboxylate decarboxylase 1
MAYEDLRAFLAVLEREGDLIHVPDKVSTRFEIAAFVRKSSDIDGPAILFDNVEGSTMQVLGGLFGSRRRIARSLELDERTLLAAYIEKEKLRIPPRMVERAPVQEIVWTGKDIDLGRLPIVTHFERDAGPYITGGTQIAKSPRTGRRNMSMHRMLLLDRNHLTVYAPKGRHLGTIIAQHEDEGKPTEIATFIGAEPVVVLASQTRKPLGVDELDIAGGMRGEAVEMVKCRTIDMEVPARAEIVIEGFTVPGRTADDGPFGEYPGTYSEAKEAPVLEVTAVTMRRDPIFQICMTGMPMTENHWMMDLPATAAAYEEAYKICPDLVDIVLTAGGTSRHHAVVSIRKRHQYEPRNILLALLSANIGIKYAVVVDQDIDVRNPLEVEWAINTRVQAEHDVIVLPTMYSPTLDPSAPAPRASSKMGIDATAPLGKLDQYSRVVTPGTDKIDLQRYRR